MSFPKSESIFPSSALVDGPSPLERARISYPSERIKNRVTIQELMTIQSIPFFFYDKNSDGNSMRLILRLYDKTAKHNIHDEKLKDAACPS